jgi:ABC-2 type transport system permease protein
MRNLPILIGREMRALFVSPALWVVLVIALIYNGVVFIDLLNILAQPMAPEGSPMEFFLGGTMLYWLLVVPVTAIIPMGTLAAEARNGTLETLLTAPVTELEVILAKFLASWAFYGILWAPTILYFFFIGHYSDIDALPIVSGYLGVLLIGGAFLSMGVLASSLTSNQIIAAVITFFATGGLFLVGLGEYLWPTGNTTFLHFMNLWSHMEDWTKGLVDTRHMVYCVSIMIFALFCSVRALESRRWR